MEFLRMFLTFVQTKNDVNVKTKQCVFEVFGYIEK